MILGKETSAHFRLCVQYVCGCVQEIPDMLNASVIKRLFKAEQLFRKLVFPALHVEGGSRQQYHTKLYHKKIVTKDTIETKSSSIQ